MVTDLREQLLEGLNTSQAALQNKASFVGDSFSQPGAQMPLQEAVNRWESMCGPTCALQVRFDGAPALHGGKSDLQH